MLASPFRRAAACAVLLAAFPGFAQAGTKTATFDVTMRVVADCVIAVSGMDFGQHGVLTAALTSSSNMTVTCTNTTPYNIGLNAGTGTGSSGTTRFMNGSAGNSDTVKLNLYRAAGGGLWGETQGSDTVGGVGNGNAQTVTVYGEIPIQKAMTPDSYKSTITATIYF